MSAAVRFNPTVRLARWLGPWAGDLSRPRSVARRSVRVDGRFDAWIYRPLGRAPTGALLLVPGLHYLGPADPRLDRFLSILADAGHVVCAPFLPDLRALRVAPTVVRDAGLAWDALLAAEERPRHVQPGVFSISFGSYPALHLAAERDVGALGLFGGYADFADAIRFSMGASDRPYDPLNRPVIFMNLLEHLEGVPDDREGLMRAWRTYVRRTWGRPEMKLPGGWDAVARDVSSGIAPALRPLFELGTGLRPGGEPIVEAALERAPFDHLDVRDVASRVHCPTWVIHGRDDDVIPYTHAIELAERIDGAELLLTGLYAHTGGGSVAPRALYAEVRTLMRILGAVAACGTSSR